VTCRIFSSLTAAQLCTVSGVCTSWHRLGELWRHMLQRYFVWSLLPSTLLEVQPDRARRLARWKAMFGRVYKALQKIDTDWHMPRGSQYGLTLTVTTMNRHLQKQSKCFGEGLLLICLVLPP